MFSRGLKVADDIIAHIRQKLDAAFRPIVLEITDDSARHAGHAGAREGGESHFRVTLVSTAFAGLAHLARHRLVYAALGDIMKEKVHALALQTMTLQEYNHKYN